MTIEKPFSPYYLERIEQKLRQDFSTGNPSGYEVRVDGLLVIAKTFDPDTFSTLGDFVSPRRTEEVAVKLYRGRSQYNDDYILYLEDNQKGSATPGESLDGIRNQLREEFEREKREMKAEWELRELQKRYDELSEDHEELREESEKMEQELEGLRGKKLHLGEINLVEIGGVMLEGFVRRNPQILARLPGGAALAGVIEADNLERAQTPPPTEAQFDFEPAGATEGDHYLELLRNLREAFSDTDFLQVMALLDQLSEAPQHLAALTNYLNQSIHTSNPTPHEDI